MGGKDHWVEGQTVAGDLKPEHVQTMHTGHWTGQDRCCDPDPVLLVSAAG